MSGRGTRRIQGGARPGAPASSPGTSRRPGTGRMPQQQQEDEGRPQLPPQPKKDPTMMYVGIGGGAVLLLVLIAVMAGGSSGGHRTGGADAENKMTRALTKINDARMRGDHRAAMDVADQALGDPVVKRSNRYRDLQQLAERIRNDVDAERIAVGKVEDFKRRVEKSKVDQTAMKMAPQFWEECNGLIQQFGTTSSAPTLKGIKEDLRRWIATESQSDWQKDYNRTKDRIKTQYLEAEKFAGAVGEWMRFGETASDPLLKSRIDSEMMAIDQQSSAAAQKLIAAAGTGAEDREKLERALQDYGTTEGAKLIRAKLRTLK